MNDLATDPNKHKARIIALAVLALLAICLYVVGVGRTGEPAAMGLLVTQLISQGGLVTGWLLGALGMGWLLMDVIFRNQKGTVTLQLALGSGFMMWLDWLLGCFGLLNYTSAWLLGAAGWICLMVQVRRHSAAISRPETWPDLPSPAAFGVPALVMLFGAAMLAPGFLWPSEYGGYDVLSYHLQLPKQWLADGQIQGYQHNVYSYFPSFTEAAFLHLGYWRGSMIDAATGCQMLHASFALITAITIGRTVSLVVGRYTGTMIGVLYLAVPWTTITGSMAYNEQTMMMFAAAALRLLIIQTRAVPLTTIIPVVEPRNTFAIGLLLGFALMVKLTAMIMFVIPMLILFIISHKNRDPKTIAKLTACFTLGLMLVFSCYLIRNTIWTGNPFFPMLTNIFGSAHWNADQVARWNAAHTPGFSNLNFYTRLQRIFSMFLAHAQFGVIVWPLMIIGIIQALRHPAKRKIINFLLIFFGLQFFFWFTMTHLQSRFAIPMLLPACIIIGLGIGGMINEKKIVKTISMVVIGLSTLISYQIYLTQNNGQISALIGATRFMQANYPDWRATNVLPPGSKIYSEGKADVFYINTPIHYHTAWDKSYFGALASQTSVDQALQQLLSEGYTHFLMDEIMLSRWMDPNNYGYDKNVTIPMLIDVQKKLVRIYPIQRNTNPILGLYRIQPHVPPSR